MDTPDYHLPEAAIAQHPVEPRDAARLLVALGQTVCHMTVADLPDLLGPGDVVVVNTSRVVPARLLLTKRTGGAAEVLLLEPAPDAGPPTATRPVVPSAAENRWHGQPWEALVRPGRRIPPGTVLFSGDVPVVEVGERLEGGRRVVRSLVDDLDRYGVVALPPYIRERLVDPSRYQTVYADQPGSVAAPTAGLHLTPEVLERCQARGAHVVGLDLAVGLGTFRPIKAGHVEDHSMHSERYWVPEPTWGACRGARRVVAIGTTTVRALESAAASGSLAGRTELYITPGYQFSVVDVLLTNFHQPRSTLLVLIEAFAGPRWRELYELAVADGYRFLSFGDAMLVSRSER